MNVKRSRVMLTAAWLALSAPAFALEFTARLSGDEEVPPVATDTSGRFHIEFNREKTKGEFQLRVEDGVRVTQAHIHCAPKGVNGPIVAFLAGFHNLGWDVDGRWVSNATITNANIIPPQAGSACPHAINSIATLIEAMKAGDTYANVHSVTNPAGVVRGQIHKD